MSDVKEEINTMLKSLNEGLGEEKVEEPVPEPVVEAEVAEPEPKPEPEPEPKMEEVKAEPVADEPKVEPVDDRDQVIADLRAKLAEKETQRKEEKPTPKPTPDPEPLELTEQDFVENLDLDELTRDSSQLNKLLNKIYQRSVTDTRKVLGEGILKAIPDIVRTNLTMMEELKKTSDQFYAENEDLKPFKKVVATVFEEIAAENPDKKYSDIVKLVAPEARKRLDLHKKATTAEKKSEKSPSLPRKGSTAGRISDKPSIEPLQAELEEMNKVVRR